LTGQQYALFPPAGKQIRRPGGKRGLQRCIRPQPNKV
jgi:hypothetical protein